MLSSSSSSLSLSLSVVEDDGDEGMTVVKEAKKENGHMQRRFSVGV